MNIREVMDDMSLAAYEMAEAAIHDREAKRLRELATGRLARLHAEMREAEREAIARRSEKNQP
jgi:hypothetical protein